MNWLKINDYFTQITKLYSFAKVLFKSAAHVTELCTHEICVGILTLSLLLITQETFIGSVDQHQTAQNVQTDI